MRGLVYRESNVNDTAAGSHDRILADDLYGLAAWRMGLGCTYRLAAREGLGSMF